MLTQRKMLAWQKLSQTTYLSKDNVNKDVAWKNLMQLYKDESSSTSNVCSLREKKEVGQLTQHEGGGKALLRASRENSCAILKSNRIKIDFGAVHSFSTNSNRYLNYFSRWTSFEERLPSGDDHIPLISFVYHCQSF